MVSPELLKRYPFFGPFNEEQLKSIALLADEISAEQGEVLFEECQKANTIYLLLEGSVDLYYKSEEEFHPKTKKEFSVGEINPGEILAVSALVEPYVLSATAKVAQPSRLIKFDAEALRELFTRDPYMGYTVMLQVAKAIMERLMYTRVQLAAAWA
jgi:CRP-like cAMP-binding protein